MILTKPREAATDLDAVRAMLAELLSDDRKDEVLEIVMSLLSQLSGQNRELEMRVSHLLRQTFGKKTERVDPRQLALLMAELAAQSRAAAPAASADGAEPAAADAEEPARVPRRSSTGRKPLPEHLPRERQVLSPAKEDLVCSACGCEKKWMGEETNALLEWVPGHFKVIEQVREKWVCRSCQGEVVIGPVGPKPLDGGLPGPSLLAHVLVSKFRDHLPLNRQARIFERDGVSIATSTLSDWVRQGAELLSPVADAIHEIALASHVLQGDDTVLRVLDSDHPGGSKRGHIWGLIGDRAWASFRYTPNWEGEKARELVEGRKGFFQVDGYGGFDALFNAPGAEIIEVGCMAHCRRKFVTALEGGDARAATAISIFQKLYAIEREATTGGLDATARQKTREERSAPLMNELGAWIARTQPQVPPKSPLGRAFTYCINQWKPLLRFLSDGRIQIDNNGVERELRSVAVGRKNYLFAGSDDGARRAAVLYTVIATSVLHGVEPLAYLRDLLEKLGGDYPAKRLPELLPDRWAAAHPGNRLIAPAA